MNNQQILIGYLGKDPETKHFDGDSQVTKFSVGVTEKWEDSNGNKQEHTEWFEVICWSWLSKIADTLKKGNLVSVIGKTRTRKWTHEGRDYRRTSVIANTLLHGVQRERQDYMPSEQDNPFRNGPTQSGGTAVPPLVETIVPEEDDLPF